MILRRLIGAYLVLGVLFMPLIYWNNAYGSRPERRSYMLGSLMAKSLVFWPSYLFAIEPKVKADSDEAFMVSIKKLLDYRESKLYASGSYRQNEGMVFMALGVCALKFDTQRRIDRTAPWRALSNKNDDDFKEIRQKLRAHFKGEDFAGVIKRGKKCAARR